MDKKSPEGYSARARLTDEEVAQRVDMIDAKDATYLLRSLTELLYGTETSENWSPDTLDELAQLMHNYGLTP